jgi:hypothetical protein
VVSVAFCAAAWLVPATAHAQYKNNSFGLDVGAWFITKPSLFDQQGNVLQPNNRPTRLANGLRIGGETSIKMSEDHWWFNFRVNVGFLRYGGNSNSQDVAQQFDAAAASALGTLMAVQGQLGVRYVIFTDRFRPYVQGALSFMHLFSFSAAASNACTGGITYCTGTDSNTATYLPHNDIGMFHLQPGVEMIFTRDTALHFYLDLQHWIVFNAADNNAVVVGLGFIFFT